MNIFQKGKITGDLTDIPGIGPAAVKKLRAIEPEEEKITNTFQLIGKVRFSSYLFVLVHRAMMCSTSSSS